LPTKSNLVGYVGAKVSTMQWSAGVAMGMLLVACGASAGGIATGGSGTAGILATGGSVNGGTGSSTGGVINGAPAGGTAGMATTNAGASQTGAGGRVIMGPDLLTFGTNYRCLLNGTSLPTAGDAPHDANCRLVLVQVAAGCSQPGLSQAASRDVTMVLGALQAIGYMGTGDPMCQLDQVSTHTGAGCDGATVAGWCYVDGACTTVPDPASCEHAVCATPVFNQLMVAYRFAWIVCD
jgi:hypothetical protein